EWAGLSAVGGDRAFPGISSPTRERARHSLSPAELGAQLPAQGFPILFRRTPWRPSHRSFRSRLQSRRSSSHPSLAVLFRVLVIGATAVMIRHYFKPQFFDGPFFRRVVARQCEASHHVIKIFFRL